MFWLVEVGVSQKGSAFRINLGVVLEGMQHARPLSVAGAAIDEELLQHHSIVAQRKDVVGEHYDLVPAHLPSITHYNQHGSSLDLQDMCLQVGSHGSSHSSKSCHVQQFSSFRPSADS